MKLEQIKEWIAAKNPELGRDPHDQEDLIEGRLIDSLDFLEFVYLLESVSGRPVDLSTLTVDDFRTLERIEQRFLAPSNIGTTA